MKGAVKGTGPEPWEAARTVFTQARLGSPKVVVVPHTPAFQRRFQESLVAGTDFPAVSHVVATMVMIQTGSCLLMSFSIITESYMGRRGK